MSHVLLLFFFRTVQTSVIVKIFCHIRLKIKRLIFGQNYSFGTVSSSPQSFQCDCSSESPSGQPFLLHECLKLIDHFHGGNFMLVLPSQLHMNYECSKANSSCCAAQLLLDNWAVVSNFQKKKYSNFLDI